MKRIIKCVVINLMIMILLLAVVEVFIWGYTKYNNKGFEGSEFRYVFFDPMLHMGDLDYYFNPERHTPTVGRLPEGLEFKSSPILIFGCSFAYGQWLEQSQTLGHKLSVILKRPVYNRAVGGQSLQEMYFQSESPVFYKQVPDAGSAIYVMIDDAYRRTYVNICEYMDTWFLLHYDIKNGELVYQDYSNPVLNFLKSLYIAKLFNTTYYTKFIDNPKNAEKVTDDALLYFVKTRENLEKHFGHKVNFYVVIYDFVHYHDILAKKLSENDFVVIETEKITSENLLDDKYVIEGDGHPSETAWTLLTPLFAEIIQENEKE